MSDRGELAHEEVAELLGAYCLDAVDPDERDAIEAHLADCPRCRAEVAELREVAALMANNDVDAPEGLWDRIAEAIDDVPPPMRLDVRRRRARDVVPLVLSAAAVVAILVLGWQVIELRRDNDRVQSQLAAADATRSALNEVNVAMLDPNTRVARLEGAGNMRAFAAITDQGAGYLVAAGMPQLETGIYEVWSADSDGALTARGSMTQSGIAKFDAGGDVAQVLVTVEPSYVQQPTTSPIMKGAVV